MKFLQELVRFNRLDNEEDDYNDLDAEDSVDEPMSIAGDEFADSEADPLEPAVGADLSGEDREPTDNTGLVGDEEMDSDLPPEDMEPSEPEDPNRQGMIRTVKGAHLVYKREVEDGTYEELWIYNASTLRDEITIRKAVLAGTDIPVNKSQSPDGAQSVETWVAGNAELMLVKGLPQ